MSDESKQVEIDDDGVQHIERFLTCKKAIKKHSSSTGELNGTMDCPICGAENTFHFGYARDYNGHTSGNCEKGCISYRE